MQQEVVDGWEGVLLCLSCKPRESAKQVHSVQSSALTTSAGVFREDARERVARCLRVIIKHKKPPTHTLLRKISFKEVNYLIQQYTHDVSSLEVRELFDECDKDRVRPA